MDQKTFEKQLMEALQKPDDWALGNGHFTHRWTGVWMHADAISSCASRVCVFASNNLRLLTLEPGEATDCFRAVQQRIHEVQEKRDKQDRRAFLNKFGGFEQ
jgi:hypothetical protein